MGIEIPFVSGKDKLILINVKSLEMDTFQLPCSNLDVLCRSMLNSCLGIEDENYAQMYVNRLYIEIQ